MKISLMSSVVLTLSVVASGSALAQHAAHGDSYVMSRSYSQQQPLDRHDTVDRRSYVDDGRIARQQRSNYTQQFHSDKTGARVPRHGTRREQQLSHQYGAQRPITVNRTARHVHVPMRGHL